MTFLKPKIPPPTKPIDPGDVENRAGASRAKRLAEGGRNATFLGAQVASASGAAKPAATLTGLQG